MAKTVLSYHWIILGLLTAKTVHVSNHFMLSVYDFIAEKLSRNALAFFLYFIYMYIFFNSLNKMVTELRSFLIFITF